MICVWQTITNAKGIHPSRLWNATFLAPTWTGDGEPANWLIGPYKDLHNLAERLRFDGIGRTELRRAESISFELSEDSVIFGRREDDVAPRLPSLQRIGLSEKERRESKEVLLPYGYRRRVDVAASDAFWKGRTLEAHHIFEDNFVKKLGAASGDLEHDKAPCVLLTADFHQGYFRKYTKDFENPKEFKGWDPPPIEELQKLYSDVYRRDEKWGDGFGSLRQIAEIVINEIAKTRTRS